MKSMTLNGIKKVFAVLSATAVISALVLSVGATSSPMIGDVSGNGVVSIEDATKLQKILVCLEEAPADYETVAETYLDGKINVRDVTAIQMYCAKIIETLPYDPSGVKPSDGTSESTQAPSSEQPTTESTEPTTQKPSEEPTVKPSDPTEPSESTGDTQPTTETDPVTEPSTTERVDTTDENGWNDQIFKP